MLGGRRPSCIVSVLVFETTSSEDLSNVSLRYRWESRGPRTPRGFNLVKLETRWASTIPALVRNPTIPACPAYNLEFSSNEITHPLLC